MALKRINTNAQGGDRKPIVEFWDGDQLVARCFKTYHPTVPWEVYMESNASLNKRTMTVDEAELFVAEHYEPAITPDNYNGAEVFLR